MSAVEPRAVSGELDRFLQFCDCFRILVPCQVSLGEWIMRGRKSRVHIDGLPALLDRFVRKMRNEKKLGTVNPDFQPFSSRRWPRCYDLTGQVPGIPMVRVCIPGIELYRSPCTN